MLIGRHGEKVKIMLPMKHFPASVKTSPVITSCNS